MRVPLDTNPFLDETLQESLPRVGVIICDCGDKISSALDTGELARRAALLPKVAYAIHEAYPCSKDGQERIRRAIDEYDLQRVVVAGCSPRLVEKLFSKMITQAGLESSNLHIANIREQCACVRLGQPAEALEQASSLVRMGVTRLIITHTAPAHTGKIVKAVLLIGSGLSALTVALAVAEAGMKVVLVEESNVLGQSLPDLQNDTRQLAAERAKTVLGHPNIETLTQSRIVAVSGHPGDYAVKIQRGNLTETYSFGVIIVGNSGRPKSLSASHWFDRKRVKTQAEFEQELESLSHSPERESIQNLVMVFCADAVQREHCSRVCCNTGIRQAITIKKLYPDANVTILFRDIYLGGIGTRYESQFIEARKLGVTFFRYRKEAPPVFGEQTIDILDTLTGEPVRIPYDRAVLSMPMVPQENAGMLAALLGLPQDEAGFLAEPRIRLRPGRYAEPGIYVLGSSQQPADTAEALFQAYLVGLQSLRFLHQENITVDTPVAAIDSGLCTGCGNCAQVCPTLAIHLEKQDGLLSRSEVDDLRCIGCGNCVVVCPVKAISLAGWDNTEIPAQISAALAPYREESQALKTGPKILALTCDWSAYGAADMAGARHLTYPAGVRNLRMNCSARFDPYHILWAFLNGADGVFLGACYPGECHYGVGNLYARERVEVLKKQLSQHKIDPRRLRLEYLSVDDGLKFSRALEDFVAEIEGT